MNPKSAKYTFACIATNRFGLGARENELQEAAQEPKAWLKQQLGPVQIRSTLTSTQEALQLHQKIKARRALQKKNTDKDSKNILEAQDLPDTMQAYLKPKDLLLTLSADTLNRSINSSNSFKWRLLHFFSNHFSVSAKGAKMTLLAPLLEREAIAPNIVGHFSTLLIAAIQHPAMLVYLNNDKNYGPNSNIGKKGNGKGLNENLAREILELHTLGVNGGYTQSDIIELAKALSGWGVSRPDRAKEIQQGGFNFQHRGHEPGKRKVLYRQYNEAGLSQGEAILKDLARHPSTAQFICEKLARHFVSDSVEQSLIDKLVKTWQATDGHLESVYITLVDASESWYSGTQKFKTPYDFFISSSRAIGIKTWSKNQFYNSLTHLGQRPFSAGSPAGFPDSSEHWNGADALFTRIEWSAQLSKRFRKNNTLDIANTALGDTLSPHSKQHLLRAESQEQALALFFMSPEFQRR